MVGEFSYLTPDPESRISLAGLSTVISRETTFGKEPTTEDYEQAKPEFINGGLYVHPSHPKYFQVQHLITVGVGRSNQAQTSADFGVVFPSQEFPIVARNPRDFAHHTVNKTGKAHLYDVDRDEAHKTKMRSGGHALISKMDSQKRLARDYLADLADFRALYGDLMKPIAARYKVKNIEPKRALADERIHDAVEVAAIHLELKNAAVNGLHRVIRKKLYSGNYSEAERRANWKQYLTIPGLHTRAKLHKLGVSYNMCQEELKFYQPYLDEKAEERAQAA